MAFIRELATIILLLFDLILFIILLLRTLTNMYAKGSRSLLLMLLGIMLMTSAFAAQSIVTQAETRITLYFIGFFYFMLLPISAWLMAAELVEGNKRKFPIILYPIIFFEVSAYIYMLTQANAAVPAFSVGGCEPIRFLTSCQFSFAAGLGGYMAAVLLPTFGAGIYLLVHYFEDTTARDRLQILAVALAILSVPVSNGLNVLIFGNAIELPMTISYLILAVLFFTAVYNHRILAFRPMAEQEFAMVDDIMLIIDLDHIIQDFNLSTLNVFHLQVRNLVNVKMEHTFIEYPQIIDLFNQPAIPDQVELVIDGVTHEFEPSVVSVIDPDTNKEIGKRLQLHDITEQLYNSDTTSITRDRLTGQYTRETFFGLGNAVFANTKRMGQSIAIVVFDIDDFRMINSRYTWAVGDEGLVQLVKIIEENIRNTDLFARFDSDNFVVLLPRADEPMAYQVCTRIKDAVATNIFEYQGQEFSFTVSQAYSVYDGTTDSSLEGFYETARTALMQSRGQGRNRLVYKDLRRI